MSFDLEGLYNELYSEGGRLVLWSGQRGGVRNNTPYFIEYQGKDFEGACWVPKEAIPFLESMHIKVDKRREDVYFASCCYFYSHFRAIHPHLNKYYENAAFSNNFFSHLLEKELT